MFERRIWSRTPDHGAAWRRSYSSIAPGLTWIRWPNRRTATSAGGPRGRRRSRRRRDLVRDRPPLVAVRKPVARKRRWQDLRAVAGSRRHDVARVPDHDRVDEVLVEV